MTFAPAPPPASDTERYVSSLNRTLASAPSDGALVVTGDASPLDLAWATTTGRPVHRHRISPVGWLPAARRAPDALQLSLSFFADDADGLSGPKYRLLLAAARLADERGFTAVWSPERHFHSFGGLYPSPTATSAALATATSRIGIRAGSVVLPLHDPIRVAEEWAVIDNLSGGRVGVSFASGWHADDFVLAPDRYADRRRHMAEGIEVVRRLWRGEAVERRNGNGAQVLVAIRPRPVQPELPFWYTAAGSPDTFRAAGRAGGFVLTNLMGQSLEDLADKVGLYREAWRDAGHAPGDGHVTLMLHAFLADDVAAAHAQAREPLLSYFRSSVDITRGVIASLGLGVRPEDLSPADVDALLEHGLERYLSDGGLFGTVDSCAAMLERVRAAGVNEVAALIDFGVPVEATLRSVELLGRVGERERARAQAARDNSVAQVEREVRELAAWVETHPVAAIQATPDTLAWLADFAPGVVPGRALITENGAGHDDILRRVATLGGYPLVDLDTETWVAARACHGPAGELTVRPAPGTAVVDDSGRQLGIGVVGRLAPEGEPVTRQRARWRTDGTLELLPTPPPRTAPLSFAQQRLWSLDHLMAGGIAYNNPVAMRMRGTLDVGALHDALREVVRRHEVLRTTFPTTQDGAQQVIHPTLLVELPVVDAAPDEVDQLAREHACLPFDLARGPLLGARLLRLSPSAGQVPEHVLLVNMHHIVSDGWSAGVLLGELAALYAAFASQEPSPLPPLPMQYADYASWQREEVDFSRDLDYWREKLADVPQLELPLDHSRGAVQDHDGARHPVQFGRELTDALRALCTQSGTTPFMALQAGLVSLLHRYSGQTDLVVGTSVAGRSRPEFEPLVGVFVNSVVIRTDASGDPPFRELLARVKATALEAFAHQEVPFERLVDELKVARDLSLTPLFQAMLVLHNTPSPSVDLGGLRLEGLDIDPGVAKLDLLLELREGPDGIAGAWEYNTALFEPATIARLTTHLVALLSDAVARPERRLSQLSLLSEAERRELLALSHGEPLGPCGFDNVAAAFEAQVARAPGALAIGDGLTYGDVEARANRLAHGLRARGVRPGERVVLLLDRPEEAITAMLAVLKAGGAYVPLDPHAPPMRLAELVRQAEPTVVLSDVDELAAGQPDTAPAATAGGADPAYVIFTSGSTGRPKGVVVSHSQLLSSTHARQTYYGGPSGTCVAPYPLSFDASVGWIYYALLTGGSIWTPEASDPRNIASLVQRVGADRFSAVPALYGQLLEAAEPGQLASLKTVSVIGERCPPEVARRHLATLPGVAFHNEYGPTEATVWCTSQPVAAPMRGEVPIGWPIPGSLALVLDRHGQLLPVGAPGELYVGGPGVAVGYLNQPGLTAERFVPDQVTGSGRLYRTGDLARRNHRGELEFLGRVDRQVKVRGFRVEPAEAETALADHPAVAEAAVTADTSEGTTRLVGYAVPRPGMTVQPEELTAFLHERLPDYLVPAHVVPLATMPRTANGKIDVAALPGPASPDRTVFVAPRNETEERLSAVLGAVLGGKTVGVHDDFFALGGDSILAITVVTRARNAGIGIDVRQLFGNPTVAGLAAVADTTPVVVVEQETISGPVPLSPNQRRFFDLALPQPHHWNGGFQLELAEPADGDTLHQAFQAVLHHHDALRQRFALVDRAWRQHCAPSEPDWTLSQLDLSDLPTTQADPRLRADADVMQGSLDLTSGPLIRAMLVRLGGGRRDRLVIGAHHLVVDGYSWRVVLEDLFSAYQQLKSGCGHVQLPAKTSSYQEWSSRMPEYLDSEQARAELRYWTQLPYHLAAPLPRDGEGPNLEADAATVRVHLDSAATRALLRHDIQPALVTAVASTLSRWTGSEQVHLDLQHHGRSDLTAGLDLTRTVGWFSVIHPVVLSIAADADLDERLASVRRTFREIPHDGNGYPALRYAQTDSPLRDLPRAEVTLNYQGVLDALLPAAAPARILDEPPGRLRGPDNPRPYPLRVMAAIYEEKLWLDWGFAEGVHHRATIAAVAAETVRVLGDLAATVH